MVVLENAKKENNIVTANFWYSGNKDDRGYFAYSIDREKFIQLSLPAADHGDKLSYSFGKVKAALRNMIEHDKYPSSYHYMWY